MFFYFKMILILIEIENMLLAEISSLSASSWRNTYTLSEYMTLPLLDGLRRSMSTLSYQEKRNIILDAAKAARALKD